MITEGINSKMYIRNITAGDTWSGWEEIITSRNVFNWTTESAISLFIEKNVSETGEITITSNGYVGFALTKVDSDVRVHMTVNGQNILRKSFYKPYIEYSEWIPVKKGTIINIFLYENTTSATPLNVSDLWVHFKAV